MAVDSMSISEIRAMMQALNSRLDSLSQEPSSTRMLINVQAPEGDGEFRISDTKARMDEEPAPAPAPAAAAPAPISYPSGTKLRWEIDGDNRRVAIALKDSAILQVKVVDTGAHAWTADPRVRQKFATYADWIASLPAGGTVTTVQPETMNAAEKRLAYNLDGFTDAKRLRWLLNTWGVRSFGQENYSPFETLNSHVTWFQHRRSQLAGITEDEDIADPRRRRLLTLKLARTAGKIQLLRTAVQKMTEEDKHKKEISVYNRGTQKMYARKGGALHLITEHYGKIVFQGRKADTFAEHGIDMRENGKPFLCVWHRRKMYEL